MPFHVPINILDFIFKGMMIGVIASAPMGPVGILCVQRTLNKGRWYGFATGIGAAASDIIYAGFAGFGMSFVMDLINNDQNRFYLQIAGSIMLLCFGLYTYRTDPTKKMHQSGQQKGTLWYNSDNLPVPGHLCPVCLCAAQPSFRDARGLCQYRGRRAALVVGTHLAGR